MEEVPVFCSQSFSHGFQFEVDHVHSHVVAFQSFSRGCILTCSILFQSDSPSVHSDVAF